MKVIFFLILFSIIACGKVTYPEATLKTDGIISDIVVREGSLYFSTDKGKVTVADAQTRRILSTITLPQVQNNKGAYFTPKIYSLDYYKGSTVIVAENGGSFRDVYLHKNGKISKIIDSSRGLMIQKIRFLDLNHCLLGLTGDTLISMDIAKNILVYQVQIGGGVFSDMELSPHKSLIAIGDESGEIMMIETHSGRKVKTLSGLNLDSINRLSYQQNTIISGGHDRRVGVYRKEGSYFIETDFFVYAVGLSPSATKGVYTDGDENELQVFDVATQAKTARLKGGETLYDTLIFLDEHTLIGVGGENKIYYWRIP